PEGYFRGVAPTPGKTACRACAAPAAQMREICRPAGATHTTSASMMPCGRAQIMRRVEDLRSQAKAKRRMAELARRAGPGMSIPADRIVMLQHARDLEAEAAGLEAQAAVLEAQMRSTVVAPAVVHQQQQMQQQSAEE